MRFISVKALEKFWRDSVFQGLVYPPGSAVGDSADSERDRGPLTDQDLRLCRGLTTLRAVQRTVFTFSVSLAHHCTVSISGGSHFIKRNGHLAIGLFFTAVKNPQFPLKENESIGELLWTCSSWSFSLGLQHTKTTVKDHLLNHSLSGNKNISSISPELFPMFKAINYISGKRYMNQFGRKDNSYKLSLEFVAIALHTGHG